MSSRSKHKNTSGFPPESIFLIGNIYTDFWGLNQSYGTKKNYQTLQHLHGGVKLATKISPLLLGWELL